MQDATSLEQTLSVIEFQSGFFKQDRTFSPCTFETTGLMASLLLIRNHCWQQNAFKLHPYSVIVPISLSKKQ